MKIKSNIPATIDISDLESETGMYQAVGLLEFITDSMANRLLLEEFVLDGVFNATDINVLAGSSPIKGQLEMPDETTWIVRLPRPFPLSRINVREIVIKELAKAEMFIAEGYFNYLLPEYGISVGAAAMVPDSVNRVRERMKIDIRKGREMVIAAEQLDIFPVIGDKVMDQSIATVTNNTGIDNLILDSFAVRARDYANRSNKHLLVSSHTISVYVHSQPQAIELALVPVVNDEPVLDQITELSGFDLTSNQDAVPLEQSKDVWLRGLQKFLDGNFTTSNTGESFKAGILFRSENPCQFETTQISNDYRLVFRDVSMFSDSGASKSEQKLSFAGTHWQGYSCQLTLPAYSTIRSAVVPFKHTLNKKAFAFVKQPPSEQWIATAKAVELVTNQWAGGVFQLDKAQAARYLLLPMMATAVDTTCALEIREDINGVPSGTIITRQSFGLADVGSRVWAAVALEEVLPLYSKKLWWLVKTTQGSAVQFVEEDPHGTGITYFSLSESGGPGRGFRFTKKLTVRPMFAKDVNQGRKLHASLSDGNNWLPVNSPENTEGMLQVFDLLPMVSRQARPNATKFTLRLFSLLKGNAVLYPPEIIYDL